MDERLAAIKQEGHRRRTGRHRRNASVTGLAVLFALALPLGVKVSGNSSQTGVYTARAECQNAADPDCGPARWDPPPSPNRPATATVDAPGATLEVAVGEPLELRVVWQDPDGGSLVSVSPCWGDGPCEALRLPCENPDAYGAWSPPPPSPGDGTVRPAHTYREPGTYNVTISLLTGSWNREECAPKPLGDPYASKIDVHATVRVR